MGLPLRSLGARLGTPGRRSDKPPPPPAAAPPPRRPSPQNCRPPPPPHCWLLAPGPAICVPPGLTGLQLVFYKGLICQTTCSHPGAPEAGGRFRGAWALPWRSGSRAGSSAGLPGLRSGLRTVPGPSDTDPGWRSSKEEEDDVSPGSVSASRPWEGGHSDPHFTEEETEADGGEGMCAGSPGEQVSETGFEPRSCCLQVGSHVPQQGSICPFLSARNLRLTEQVSCGTGPSSGACWEEGRAAPPENPSGVRSRKSLLTVTSDWSAQPLFPVFLREHLSSARVSLCPSLRHVTCD
ncbi:uncharacterized protein LOC141560052 [Sminthopsis crassicaudata]|uniref:uncharacterized protein LOC141560052 n=1 Tax=Sminthopsis crassicaudata TaxID=9301 RepID=UPI003D69A8F6